MSGYLALFSPGCEWLGAVAVVSEIGCGTFSICVILAE